VADDLLNADVEPLSYAQGSWGPDAATALAEPTGWRLQSDVRVPDILGAESSALA
jgi:hypothetical protein